MSKLQNRWTGSREMKRGWTLRGVATVLGLCGLFSATGCQMEIGGQTLPSPYYISDDVQYFPAGPEFLLSNEATAMELQEQELLEQGLGPAGVPLEGARRPGFTQPRPY